MQRGFSRLIRGRGKTLRTAEDVSGKRISDCERCPLSTWRIRGLCSVCVTTVKSRGGRLCLSLGPLVTWDEEVFKKKRRPAGFRS